MEREDWLEQALFIFEGLPCISAEHTRSPREVSVSVSCTDPDEEGAPETYSLRRSTDLKVLEALKEPLAFLVWDSVRKAVSAGLRAKVSVTLCHQGHPDEVLGPFGVECVPSTERFREEEPCSRADFAVFCVAKEVLRRLPSLAAETELPASVERLLMPGKWPEEREGPLPQTRVFIPRDDPIRFTLVPQVEEVVPFPFPQY